MLRAIPVILFAALSSPAMCEVPVLESNLAPIYLLDDPAVSGPLWKVSVHAPKTGGGHPYYLDDLSQNEVEMVVDAVLVTDERRSLLDDMASDLGFIWGVVSELYQTKERLSTYVMRIEVFDVWPKRGIEELSKGTTVDVAMEGNFRRCPNREEEYHPYPCKSEIVLVKVRAVPNVFEGCFTLSPFEWIVLDRLPNQGRELVFRAMSRLHGSVEKE